MQWEEEGGGGVYQDDMNQSLIQGSCEVTKSVNALSVSKSLCQGSTQRQSCNHKRLVHNNVPCSVWTN